MPEFSVRKEASNEHMSIDELCKALRNACVVKTVFMFLQEQVNKKERMQRYGTAKTYANAYHRFRDFRNNTDLTFDELTPDLIEAYEDLVNSPRTETEHHTLLPAHTAHAHQ